MANEKEMKEKTFYWRMICVVLLSFVITYGLLNFFLHFGSYGLFFAGAIIGGLWGNVWHMWLYESPGKKWYSLSTTAFIIIIVLSIIALVLLILIYPLPAI